MISWPLIKKGKTDNTTEVFVCYEPLLVCFLSKKQFFWRGCACECLFLSLFVSTDCVCSSFSLSCLFVYSFVFIAHRVCRNCLPPISLSLSPFQTKISPLQLVFVNFPTDIVTTFIPSFWFNVELSERRFNRLPAGLSNMDRVWVKRDKTKKKSIESMVYPIFSFCHIFKFPTCLYRLFNN